MTRRRRVIFWLVAVHAALLTLAGFGYTVLAISVPLHLNAFGHPIPAWIVGMFLVYWGVRMLFRLFSLPWKEQKRLPVSE